LLTGICTTATPASVFSQSPVGRLADWRLRNLLGTPHLPQGAPTSPALANLSAWRLDQRLAGLARRLGANYTRYADDIAFSGDDVFAERTQTLLHVAKEIVESEDFAVNARKTRLMRRGARQQVTGIVVNDHLNVPRPSYDALKAILHNCARHGPAAQNRHGVPDFRAHLDGRVAWVEAVNPPRGAKLRRIFEAIAW
jgi:retron-type reverse transcriptase